MSYRLAFAALLFCSSVPAAAQVETAHFQTNSVAGELQLLSHFEPAHCEECEHCSSRLGCDCLVDTLPVVTNWHYEVLPEEILYRSYLGDPKGSRFASRILHNTDAGWLWSLEAGGRVGIWRYGTPSGTVGPSGRPEGWQLDIEGAAFPRLNFAENLDLDAVDFRVGVPLTYQRGNWQYKLELYHLSSHAGDEFIVRNPDFERVNYLRDAVILGAGYYANPDLLIYGEGEVAWNTDGGSEPLHFQFGFDYSPTTPSPRATHPQPFFAVNAGLREDVDFGGGVNIVGGLQWRGVRSGRLFRAGFQYYNGESWQYEFFDEHEELLGFSLWYDF